MSYIYDSILIIATISASPSGHITPAHSSLDINYHVGNSQNLANIHLNLGKGRSKTVLISVSKTIQNSAYVDYPTLTSQDDTNIPSTTLDPQDDHGSDALLISFRKCNRDSQLLHPTENSEKDPPTTSKAHSIPRFLYVDLESESNQTVLISGCNTLCGEISIDYTNVDPTESSQVIPKFQSKQFTDHAYVNMNPEEDSSTATPTPNSNHAQHSD